MGEPTLVHLVEVTTGYNQNSLKYTNYKNDTMDKLTTNVIPGKVK